MLLSKHSTSHTHTHWTQYSTWTTKIVGSQLDALDRTTEEN